MKTGVFFKQLSWKKNYLDRLFASAERQKRAADNIIQQKAKGDVNLSKALTKAGYSKQTATKAAKVVAADQSEVRSPGEKAG